MTGEVLIGFVLAISYLLPMLGAKLEGTFGVHPRIISLLGFGLTLFMTLCVPTRVAPGKSRQNQQLLLASCLIYVLLVALNLDWSIQGSLVVSASDLRASYEYAKFPRFVIFCLPQIVVGCVVYPVARTPKFWRGFSVGALSVGLAGLSLVLSSYSDFTSQIFSAFADAGAGWSRVNVATHLAIVFGFAQARFFQSSSPNEKRLMIGYCAAFSFSVIVVDQRAQFLALSVPILVWLYRRSKTGLAVVVALFASSMSSLLLFASEFGFHWQVGRFASLFSGTDNSLGARADAWAFVLKAIPTNVTGEGFASFYHNYLQLRYPHNIVLESVYELGWLGGIISAWWVYLSVRLLLPDVKRGVMSGVSCALVLQLVVGLKSGDCTGIGSMLIVMFLLQAREDGIRSWGLAAFGIKKVSAEQASVGVQAQRSVRLR